VETQAAKSSLHILPDAPAAPPRNAFAALRQFARARNPLERCELCSAELPGEHDHLFDPAARQLLCACNACAILFSGQGKAKFRRVPRRVELLPSFAITDEQWLSLQLPIKLAFFFHSTPLNRVAVLYPSPAGATEASFPIESWNELAAANPVLTQLEPDVETLLVNRTNKAHDYYRAPIDQCFKLVGIIRTTWRGLSGGSDAWANIEQFFTDLRKRSRRSSRASQ